MSSTSNLIMLGAGGHAKVCLEVLLEMGLKVDFCVAAQPCDSDCLGVTVLSYSNDANVLNDLKNKGYHKIFIALGSNPLRRKLALLARTMGFFTVTAISPSAIVSRSARIGAGSVIMPGAIINAASTIGDYSIINTAATVDHDATIGEYVHVAPQCALAGCVSIGELSCLGIGVQVIPSVRIGANSTIGAGSLVIRDVPDKVLAFGRPAKIIKNI